MRFNQCFFAAVLFLGVSFIVTDKADAMEPSVFKAVLFLCASNLAVMAGALLESGSKKEES